MEHLGYTPERNHTVEAARRAAHWILDRIPLRDEPTCTTKYFYVYPPDPEAEYERLYRKGEIEIVIEPEPWAEDYLGIQEKLRLQTEEEYKNGIIEVRGKREEGAN